MAVKPKEAVTKFVDTTKTKWLSFSKKTQIGLIATLGTVIVAAVIITVILNVKNYTVLYSDISRSEATEILNYARTTLGVSDIKYSDDAILVPANQAEDLRVNLSMAGYPTSTFNYDVWDTGVSMFSTDMEKREKQKQQLQTNLMATLNGFEGVDSSVVILNIPETVKYVIAENDQPTSASVVLHLKGNSSLSTDEVDGIYNLVKNSVPGLTLDNITVTDGTGAELKSGLSADEITKANESVQLYYKQLEFSQDLTKILEDNLANLFDGVFSKYTVAVNVALDFDDKVTQKTEYTPSVPEEGTSGGMISEYEVGTSVKGTAEDGGLIGTSADADISPDYPTVELGENADLTYEYAKNIKYLVNEEITQITSNGYDIDKVSASVVVNDTSMTVAEMEDWQQAIAYAIGTSTDNVKMKQQSFQLSGQTPSDGTIISTTNRNELIFVIICLGALLIMLLFIALMTAGAKKKRRVRKQRTAYAAADVGGGSATVSIAADTGVKKEPDENIEIASLVDHSPEENRELILKREIRDFSKTNPEIVAQLIRTWMKSDD